MFSSSSFNFFLVVAAALLVSTQSNSKQHGEKQLEKQKQNQQANIVFILTDDQDVILNGMETMNATKKLIFSQGMTFRNAFVSSPVCCVSRASMLSGRYTHNTYTFNNSWQGGCGNSDTWNNDVEKDTYAVYAKNNGYRTLYAGKYLNTYGYGCCGGISHIPPGWTDWYGLQGNSRYYNYNVSDNGVRKYFGDNYTTDYFTDNIKRRALKFLDDLNDTNVAFLMVLATPAAHDPFTPAPQYNFTNKGQMAPRTVTYNMTGNANQNKHQLMREVPAMTQQKVDQTDTIYRFRHGALRSVDDMVSEVYSKIKSMGQDVLNNTYWIYFSDHGFHLGQFGMHFDKRQLYETDLRVPMAIAGPGIDKGVSTDILAASIDLGPTIVDLISNTVPDTMDGMSLKSVLLNKNNEREEIAASQQQFYVEYYGEQGNSDMEYQECSCAISGFVSAVCDQWNNTYQCARVLTPNTKNGTIYCQFLCFDSGRNEIECPSDLPEGQGEYYELDNDPWNVNNLWSNLSSNAINTYTSMIEQFSKCSGQSECNALRLGRFPDVL